MSMIKCDSVTQKVVCLIIYSHTALDSICCHIPAAIPSQFLSVKGEASSPYKGSPTQKPE